MTEAEVKHVKNVINGWKKSWSISLSSRAEGALRERVIRLILEHGESSSALTPEGATAMTPDEVKAKVRAVLRLMRPEWQFSTWSENFGWCAFHTEPKPYEVGRGWAYGSYHTDLGDFDLPPFPGDYRDSLVEREE